MRGRCVCHLPGTALPPSVPCLRAMGIRLLDDRSDVCIRTFRCCHLMTVRVHVQRTVPESLCGAKGPFAPLLSRVLPVRTYCATNSAKGSSDWRSEDDLGLVR